VTSKEGRGTSGAARRRPGHQEAAVRGECDCGDGVSVLIRAGWHERQVGERLCLRVTETHVTIAAGGGAYRLPLGLAMQDLVARRTRCLQENRGCLQ
jgi:hypothetical protein